MDGQSDIVDDIFEPNATYAPTLPPLTKGFLPWHRPRKQFVRTRQWQYEIKSLLVDLPLTDGKPLSYLGLPGADLLDLRHFHDEICLESQVHLRFLGFNSEAKPGSESYNEMNISLDEVRRLPFVDDQSQILSDDFVLLANEQSLAFDRAKQYGPFDIVNLDLCDGFGKHAPGAAHNTYYNAISRLFALQARHTRPWLLFLTTRADKQTVHYDVLDRVKNKYRANLEESAAFLTASREFFALDLDSLDDAITTAKGHLRVFITGLSKWFISMALQGQPPVAAHLRSAMGYKVVKDSEELDMISLAFRCVPTYAGYPDPLGLANVAHGAPTEAELAIKALNKIARVKDVDTLLSGNEKLTQELISSMANLVQLARYDGIEYRQWALGN